MRPLYAIAVVLGVLVAAFYGWRLLRSWGGPSPEALAERALSAESAAERQQAAVDLASVFSCGDCGDTDNKDYKHKSPIPCRPGW